MVLAGIGAVLVWAATRSELIADGEGPQTYLYRHLLNTAIGLVLLEIDADRRAIVLAHRVNGRGVARVLQKIFVSLEVR